MAKQQGVSMGTVVKTYALLENEGWVDVRSQSGFYVRPRPGIEFSLPRIAQPMVRPSYVGVSDLGAEVMISSTTPENVSFGWALPEPELFPNRRIARMLSSIIRDDPSWLAKSPLNSGHAPLAREIARRYVHDGVNLSHTEVLITLGCTEALNLSIRAVSKPGDTVAVEAPASFGLLQILQSLSVRVLEIPACPINGLDLVGLRTAFLATKIVAVIVMPNFQNPLGCSLSDSQKCELYGLLKEFDIPAIENDVYSDLYHHDRKPKPLKALDTDGRILLCSSFTKTLAPGLRLGWCAPGRYLERVRRLKMANTMGTPLVLQKTICDFLKLGGYDHHLRALRRIYKSNIALYSDSIRRTFPPGSALSRPNGGYILWIQFPTGVDSLTLFKEALKRNISIAPGILFSSTSHFKSCVRVSASAPWTERIHNALSLLGKLAAAQLASNPNSS